MQNLISRRKIEKKIVKKLQEELKYNTKKYSTYLKGGRKRTKNVKTDGTNRKYLTKW